MTEASVPSIAPRWITSAPVSGKVGEAESELRLAANGGATLLWSSFGRSVDSVTLFARTTLVRR